MLKRLLILLVFLPAITCSMAHPVRVSVVNITIEGKLIRITVNTFVDDWETAYFHYYGNNIQLKNPENHNGEWFLGYFNDSFRINNKIKGNHMVFTMDTVYFNDLSMTMEMHTNLRKKPKTLYIYNAILTDIFADQTNLLIYSAEGVEKGIRFDYHKHEETILLR
jgi:hypothetical protein